MDIKFILGFSLIIREIGSLPAIVKKSPIQNSLGVSSLPSEENELIKHIEKYVQSVPMINFEGDVILLQFPNRVNKKTDYRHVNPDLIDKIVYERDALDIDKDVVVLTSGQDKIETRDQKKVFVVLRRNTLMGDRRLYYASYLYVKEPVPGQKGIHTFGNRKVSVEWDFWNDREVKESKNDLEDTSACQATIFVPCLSNETFDFPLPKRISAADKSSGTPKIKPETSNKTLTFQDGESKYYDFFSDLDPSPVGTLGRAVKFQFQSMSKFGKPHSNGAMDISQGEVFSFMESDMKNFQDMIQDVVEKGMGLVKTFNGRYGGLGTAEAQVDEVLKSLVDLGDVEGFLGSLNDEEYYELEDEAKLPSSGGLGGMINADELREAEEEGIVPSKKKLHKKRSHRGRGMSMEEIDKVSPEVPEGPYVKFGWNTDSDPSSLNDPFVGFGGCRYRKVTLDTLKNKSNRAALIKLYQTILKTQCITKDTKLYEKILSENIIKIDEDNVSFTVLETSRLMRQEKLPQKERVRLYRGMELFFFSKAYIEVLNSERPTVAPDNAPLSRNVFTLGRMVLMGLASKRIPTQHSIKLGRNLVRTLKIALSKLAEDNTVNSAQEKEINFNDRVYLVGLIQFIIHSYDAIFTNPKYDVQKSFELFYVQNREALEDKINLY